MTKSSTKDADALKDALAQIEKRYGAGAVFSGTSPAHILNVEAIPTGSIGLDIATGVGGFARGRVVEVFGEESTGKTTICLQVIRSVQQMGLAAAIIDLENAVDLKYANSLGVDTESNKWIVSQPAVAEQALEIAETLMGSGKVGVVIVDSIAALVTDAVLTKDIGDAMYGSVARLMSSALPRLKAVANSTQTLLLFTNQMRVKIGATSPIPGHVVKKTFGGEAVRYYADLRVELKRKMDMETREEEQYVTATCVKNKLAPPFRSAAFTIRYGVGVDKPAELADLAVEHAIITQNGAHYTYGENKYHGRAALVEAIRENPDIAKELEGKIK